jgi:hypothetical protein
MAARKPASVQSASVQSASVQSAAAPAKPTVESFVAEYMRQLNENKPPKVGIIERVAKKAEDLVVAGVRNSQSTVGRCHAAWQIAGMIRERSFATEHARFAEREAQLMQLPYEAELRK